MASYEQDETASMMVVGVLAVIGLLGLAMNVSLLVLLRRVPEKSTSFQLIHAIGLVGLLLCLFTVGVCIARPALGAELAFASSVYCPVLSSSTFFLCGVSGILMALLALERYSVVCRQSGLSPVAVWVLFALTSLVAAVLIGGNSMVGGFKPGPSYIFCVPDGTAWSRFFSLGFDVLFNLPLVMLVVCYSAIIVRCYRARVPAQLGSKTRKAALRALFFLLSTSSATCPSSPRPSSLSCTGQMRRHWPCTC